MLPMMFTASLGLLPNVIIRIKGNKTIESVSLMHPYAESFAKYCEENFDLRATSDNDYKSLSVCILDCVYSLRARYYETTLPTVNRYAAKYMGGDRYASGDSVSMLIAHIEESGGPESFAIEVLVNRQKIGGRGAILKSETVLQLARHLQALQIETIEDFQQFESVEILESAIRAAKGMGDAGTNYLFMLAGDPNRCKPDVHVHHCIQDACGCDVKNEDCQLLFTDAVDLLRNAHPNLTVRALDYTIWEHYRQQK